MLYSIFKRSQNKTTEREQKISEYRKKKAELLANIDSCNRSKQKLKYFSQLVEIERELRKL